ncbi:MAG: NAD(P)H-dependent oxidoreductase [Planctomycetota bacterium]
MSQPAVLAFSGSLRAGSYNKKMVRIAARAAEAAGADVKVLDLDTLSLPIFNEDTEAQGTPDNALKLRGMMLDADGFLIASPEYNSSVSAALKNAIDWASRPCARNPSGLAAYAGKSATIMSASPGNLGGLRGLVHLRAILGNLQMIVLPEQFALSSAGDAFDERGELTDEKAAARVEGLGRGLAECLIQQLK